tara:strand:- start:10581 stop:11141 length:561 start_codon:yes stop_codon:yes gene_type:complete
VHYAGCIAGLCLGQVLDEQPLCRFRYSRRQRHDEASGSKDSFTPITHWRITDIRFKKFSDLYHLPEQTQPAGSTGVSEVIFMIPTCPACHSDQIQHCHYGKRVGGTIGTVAGAFSGASGATAGALEGARIGATVMRFAGPTATASGAVLGAISGGLIGCVAGLKLGEVVDQELLCRYRCTQCGKHF